LCQILEYLPDYSNGLPAVLNDIATSVESLKTSLEKERQKNRLLEDSLVRLNKQLMLLQEKLGEHQRLLSRINELKKRMLELGVVTTQKGNRIEFTLNGLNFVPGGISLPQPEQQIIERMAREIQKLPYQHIEIRIIQAAPGNRQYNQTLANQRAKSVALLFQTTAYIPDDKISSEGAILENSASSSEAILQVAITFQQED
jgi:outer membrane protein OmpA-like peptidoglycan-associated protein